MAKKRRHNLDMEHLGDPWSDNAGSDAPDAGDLQHAHEELRRQIELHPGIEGSKQPRAWHVPDDELSDELFGPKPEAGLSPDEKQLVYEQGKRDLDSATRKDVKAAKKDVRKQEQREAKASKRSADLWAQYQRHYPQQAKDVAAVEQAAVQVLGRWNLDADTAMTEYADDFLDDVASQVYVAQEGIEPKRREVPQEHGDADRQQMLPAQSSAAPKGKQSDDDSPGDFMSELQEVQRKGGYF